MTWQVIDIHAGISDFQREFMPRWAIWDTVVDQFITDDDGEQGWDSVDEFRDGMRDDLEMQARGVGLIPKE